MSENQRRVEFSRLISVKECPVCGGKLDKIYLTAPRGYYLSAEKAKLGVYFLDTIMPSVSSGVLLENAPALKCENCGIAIIDYRAPRYTPKSFLKKCVKCGKEIPIASEECSYCGTKQPEYEV
jgi:ssDNA-binding Zn-finger/Zn-ribbon topoisomerase 1